MSKSSGHQCRTWRRDRTKRIDKETVAGMLPVVVADPITCGMERNVEMQNAPAIMFNREETVQAAETKVRNREKVECGNRRAMVVQESEPLAGFALVRNALQSLQIARHDRFGDLEAQ